MNAYVLALGSTMLLSGKLSAKFGNKRILIIGMLIFTISSLLSALSVSIYMLVVFRFFQGVGASLFMPSSMSLLYNAYPDDKKRAQMLGIWASIISVATGCGSFIGGTLINLFGWRGIFLINLPLGIISIVYVFSSVKKNIRNQSIKIDYIDNLLLIFSLTFMIGYLVEGKLFGYLSKNMLILLVLFLISLAILVYRELHSDNPIIPINLLSNSVFEVSNLIGFVVNVSLYALVLVLGVYFQVSLKLSPMVSGLLILPGMIVLVLGNIIYSKLVKKHSIGMLTISASLLTLIAAVLMILLSFLNKSIPLWLLIIVFAIMSFGIGMLTPAATTLLMEVGGQKNADMAGAVLNANKQIGGLFGTALSGLILSMTNWSQILSTTFYLNGFVYLITFVFSFLVLRVKK